MHTQRHGRVQETQLKCTKARNDYLLNLAGANAAMNKYYLQDVSTLIDVRNMHFVLGDCMFMHVWHTSALLPFFLQNNKWKLSQGEEKQQFESTFIHIFSRFSYTLCFFSLSPASAVTLVSICLWRQWWNATWPAGGASKRLRRRGLSSWRLRWHRWTRVETEMHCCSNMTPPSAFRSDSTTTHMKETRWSYRTSGTAVWPSSKLLLPRLTVITHVNEGFLDMQCCWLTRTLLR